MSSKNQKQDFRTKKMVTMGMMAALAYVMVLLIRIPMVAFLSYEPKDIAIVICGFIYGPVEALIVSVVVSLIEMITISQTGWIGALMNILSSCAFACTAALIYRKKHTLKGAVLGLIGGVVVMCAAMMLWNYLITPIYMGYPREAVAAMLPTVFLPFNLIKGGLNASLTMLLYKPLVTTLRKARLVRESAAGAEPLSRPSTIRTAAVAALVLAACVVLALILSGKISL